jgi:NAD(P)-dependent dehydrogenase (short-subunit alcohol dehydrogenase family)
VVVTGAARGLGKAISHRLAQSGMAVIGVDLSDNIHKTIAGLPGDHHVAIVGDVTSQDVLTQAFDAQPPDCWLAGFVANAGIFDPGDSLTYSMESWDRLHNVLLRSYFLGAREAASRMHHGGSILMLSSINGTLGFSGRAAYGAAKAGVQGLVRSLAAEWAKRGIRVNAIAPGVISTEMQRDFMDTGYATDDTYMSHVPLNRYGRPEEIANAANFLISNESSYITGVLLPVDGGWSSCGMDGR